MRNFGHSLNMKKNSPENRTRYHGKFAPTSEALTEIFLCGQIPKKKMSLQKDLNHIECLSIAASSKFESPY